VGGRENARGYGKGWLGAVNLTGSEASMHSLGRIAPMGATLLDWGVARLRLAMLAGSVEHVRMTLHRLT
jgi:hypothetical protein